MIDLLRRRNFALLWFGGLISFIGDWVLFVALPVYVYNLTGSVLATGTMFAASMVPSILLGSVAGVFVDRWDRKWTMVTADLVRAPLLLVMLAIHSADQVWIAYVMTFILNTIRQFSAPAEMALLPRLVNKDELVTANTLSSLNGNLARLVGPALGGVLLASYGFGSAVLVDAVSFVIGGGMVALISASRSVTRASREDAETAEAESRRGLRHEWLDGLLLVRHNRTVASIFAIVGTNALAEGILSVLLIVFVEQVLRGGAPEVGWLLTSQAVGGLLVGRLGSRVQPRYLVGIGFLLLGLGDLAIFNIPILAAGIVLIALVGIPVVGLQAGIQTLFQTKVPDRYRGRVLGAFGTAFALLTLLGMIFASLFGASIGVVASLSMAAVLDAVAGLIALWLLRDGEGAVEITPDAANVEAA